jgi:hypothetical protein
LTPLVRTGLRYQLVGDIVERSQRVLKAASENGGEAFAVWVGEISGSGAIVFDVWALPAESAELHARVSFREVLSLSDQVAKRSWFVLAQLHTHPGAAFHSDTDDRFPISNQSGFISIVVPGSGRREAGVGWAWFELLGQGTWRELDASEVRVRFSAGGIGIWQRIWNAISARLSS